MRDCLISTPYVEPPDASERRKLLWGSLAKAQDVTARIQQKILQRATVLYEGGMSVEEALQKATDHEEGRLKA